MFKDSNKFKTFDFPLLIAVTLLAIIGIVLILSSSKSFDNSMKYVLIQSVSFVIGLVLLFFIAFYDYEFLAEKSWYIYGVNIFLLILVIVIGIGTEEVGGKSWFRFAGIGLQPSEIAKIGFIICLAYQIDRFKNNINDFKNIVFTLLHLISLLVLILLQPDFGTAMVFIGIYCGMIFISRINIRYIIGALISVIAACPILYFFLLKDYQRARIQVFLQPELDPLKTGYQVIQSKIAIGSGQITGDGLFKGIQTQMGYLPAKHTDFIFASAGEELGFLGLALIIGLITFIIIRIFYIGYNARDALGGFICVGIASMFLVQSFENIGMCIGLMPVTGITLPFLSYGGSSLMANLIAIGFALNVANRRKKINF